MKNNGIKPKVIFIGGPTAVGKTALSIRLAKALNGTVINGDAYQIYRGMDIGTAKVTEAEKAGVPHALIDIVDPGTPYSVARFQKMAMAAIEAVTEKGMVPIVVGGTGFYLNALRLGLPLGGDAPPSDYRKTLQAKLAEVGEWALWQQLHALDPAAAEAIPPANSRRVIRALEVIESTGQLFSKQVQPEPPLDAYVIGLTTDREALYQRINLRVTQMLEDGLEAEVRSVLALAGPDAQAMKAIGYKEWLPYFEGNASLDDTVALIQKNSRHYAKRQLTYFRHQMPTHWADIITEPALVDQMTATLSAWLNERN